MIERPAGSTKQLLRASFDDEATLQYPLPHSGFGFHAQQAVEKLYKALLANHLGRYPFSHDLMSLRKSVAACGIVVPDCGFKLERLSDYAGNARYDDPIPLDEDERLLLRRCIADLRKFVQAQTGCDNE